ncbi:MAG: hypothetical protein JNK73_10460 [Bacteroidia bacterium]|nr:hypothetical protein [Bacteroidia bacterium]
MRVLPCILLLFFLSLFRIGFAISPFPLSGSYNTYSEGLNLQNRDSLHPQGKTGFFRQACLSFNILSALSSEFGFVLESGRMEKNLSLIIPFGFGFGDPLVESVKKHSEAGSGDYVADPVKKLLDLGLGFNGYFNEHLKNQPFVGLCFRAMQYKCSESWSYPSGVYEPSRYTVYDQTMLYRYTATINSGFSIPFHSRFRITLMAMLGMRYDAIPNRITDPKSGEEVPNFDKPFYPFFNAYYCLGFVF